MPYYKSELGGEFIRITDKDFKRKRDKENETKEEYDEWMDWLYHMVEIQDREDEFIEHIRLEFLGEGEETLSAIVDLFLAYKCDGLTRTERQNYKRTLETKIDNTVDEEIWIETKRGPYRFNPREKALDNWGWHEMTYGTIRDGVRIKGAILTRVEIKKELKKLCKVVTSENKQKNSTKKLCDMVKNKEN